MQRGLSVICKVLDVFRYPTTGDLLEDEAHVYAALQARRGQVIPTLYGFYEVWGILKLLVLEPVGDAIPEGENINQKNRMKMRAALRCINKSMVISHVKTFIGHKMVMFSWWTWRGVDRLGTSLNWTVR